MQHPYKIVYVLLNAQTIMLEQVVLAVNEQDAKEQFLCSGEFYNTNDPRNVLIESIRKVK